MSDRRKVTYWVMYRETTRNGRPMWPERKPFQPAGPITRTQQHYGTANLATAEQTVADLNLLASQESHFLSPKQWPNLRLVDAWIEVEERYRLDSIEVEAGIVEMERVNEGLALVEPEGLIDLGGITERDVPPRA